MKKSMIALCAIGCSLIGHSADMWWIGGGRTAKFSDPKNWAEGSAEGTNRAPATDGTDALVLPAGAAKTTAVNDFANAKFAAIKTLPSESAESFTIGGNGFSMGSASIVVDKVLDIQTNRTVTIEGDIKFDIKQTAQTGNMKVMLEKDARLNFNGFVGFVYPASYNANNRFDKFIAFSASANNAGSRGVVAFNAGADLHIFFASNMWGTRWTKIGQVAIANVNVICASEFIFDKINITNCDIYVNKGGVFKAISAYGLSPDIVMMCSNAHVHIAEGGHADAATTGWNMGYDTSSGATYDKTTAFITLDGGTIGYGDPTENNRAVGAAGNVMTVNDGIFKFNEWASFAKYGWAKFDLNGGLAEAKGGLRIGYEGGSRFYRVRDKSNEVNLNGGKFLIADFLNNTSPNMTTSSKFNQYGGDEKNLVERDNFQHPRPIYVRFNGAKVYAAKSTEKFFRGTEENGEDNAGALLCPIVPQIGAGGLDFNTQGHDVTFNKALIETAAGAPIVKSGAGALTLTSTNKITGAVEVKGGTLRVAAGSDFTAASVHVWSGAALVLEGNNSFTGSVTVEEGGTCELGGNAGNVTTKTDGVKASRLTAAAGTTALTAADLDGIDEIAIGEGAVVQFADEHLFDNVVVTLNGGTLEWTGADGKVCNLGFLNVNADSTLKAANNIAFKGICNEAEGAELTVGDTGIGMGILTAGELPLDGGVAYYLNETNSAHNLKAVLAGGPIEFNGSGWTLDDGILQPASDSASTTLSLAYYTPWSFVLNGGYAKFNYSEFRHIDLGAWYTKSGQGGSIVVNDGTLEVKELHDWCIDVKGPKVKDTDQRYLNRQAYDRVAVNGGMLKLPATKRTVTTNNVVANGAFSALNVNGGTLEMSKVGDQGTADDYLCGLKNLSIGTNGATFKTDLDVTVTKPLHENGKNSSLTKRGVGTLTFEGDNVWTGDTIVEDGTLRAKRGVGADAFHAFPEGLAALWTFDDGTGRDVTGNGNDMVPFESNLAPIAYTANGAHRGLVPVFGGGNGTGGGSAFTAGTAWMLNRTASTFSLWMYTAPGAANTQAGLLSARVPQDETQSADSGIEIFTTLSADGKTNTIGLFGTKTADGATTAGSTNIEVPGLPVGQWHMITVSFDWCGRNYKSGIVTVYTNGVEAFKSVGNRRTYMHNEYFNGKIYGGQLCIGRGTGTKTGNYHNEFISAGNTVDDVAVFARVLSADEVKGLYEMYAANGCTEVKSGATWDLMGSTNVTQRLVASGAITNGKIVVGGENCGITACIYDVNAADMLTADKFAVESDAGVVTVNIEDGVLVKGAKEYPVIRFTECDAETAANLRKWTAVVPGDDKLKFRLQVVGNDVMLKSVPTGTLMIIR